MTVNQLIPGELSILRALSDQRPKNSVELAKETDLPGWACRSMAKELVRRRLLTRHMVPGSWEITQAGLEHLAVMNQLRLVR